MRVGVSMLTLVPGEMGGSETYARALCRALGARPDLDAVAFVTAAAPDAGEGLPTEVVSEYPAARTAPAKVLGLVTSLLRCRKLAARFGDLDVVHYPFTIPVPATDVPSVVTLHDLQHIDLPGMFSRSTRAFRRVAYDRAARRARVVIVPSEFVRDRAVAALGLDPARVCVVPHGLDHDVFSPADIPRESFILYPARVWPHKNHARLIAALASLRRDRPDLELVLTGGGGTEAFAGTAGVRARGVVSQAELVDLYRRAACVVFPSLYEGFGAPPLEAMACGAPVAASTAGSLPEVCGGAAVLFDPYDEAAIADGVRQALERSEQLTALGLERASLFTWAASAVAHERAYRLAAGL
jgi:glycosyltransferase involved in cell wall biosynthesis